MSSHFGNRLGLVRALSQEEDGFVPWGFLLYASRQSALRVRVPSCQLDFCDIGFLEKIAELLKRDPKRTLACLPRPPGYGGARATTRST